MGRVLRKVCVRTETLKKELAALKKANEEGVHKLVELIYNVRCSGALVINLTLLPHTPLCTLSLTFCCCHVKRAVGALHINGWAYIKACILVRTKC